MQDFYSVTDLLSGNPVYINKLNSSSLQSFYDLLCSNVYSFELSNGDIINLLFEKDQFCHLIGFHKFGYEGIDGWDKLKANPIPINSLSLCDEFKCMQYRIANFNRIYFLLNNPNIYIYEASKYEDLSYKSVYFAVYSNNGRLFKLGIGNSANGIHYPETIIIDKDMPNFNYYILPENLLKINSTIVSLKEEFLKEQDKLQLVTVERANYIQKVSAGTGILLNDECFEKIILQKNSLTMRTNYCVTVSGDSMEPKYHDGDILMVEDTLVETGDTGIFVLGGEGYVKKYIDHQLISLNDLYPPIAINEEIYSRGKVIGVVEVDWIIG